MLHQCVSHERNHFCRKLRTSTSLQLLLQHIWAPYHNRPRHRRHLMRTNVDWHALYDGAISLTRKDKYGNSALWTRLRGHDGSRTLGQPYNGVSTLSFYPQSDIYHYSPQDRAWYNPGRNLLVFGLPGSAMQSQYLVLHSRTLRES